jgi:ABC-type amino acid transport substrate-binding protein
MHGSSPGLAIQCSPSLVWRRASRGAPRKRMWPGIGCVTPGPSALGWAPASHLLPTTAYDGSLAAFDVDLAREVGRRLDVNPQFVANLPYMASGTR